MTYFAEVKNGFVTNIIVAEQSFIDTLPFPNEWIEYFYPPCPAGKTAGVGYIYDQTENVFYPPQPYPSWILNHKTWEWETPDPYPEDGKNYYWSEVDKKWILTIDATA